NSRGLFQRRSAPPASPHFGRASPGQGQRVRQKPLRAVHGAHLLVRHPRRRLLRGELGKRTATQQNRCHVPVAVPKIGRQVADEESLASDHNEARVHPELDRDLPRKPIWCFYEARDDRYSVRHLPLELCTVVVFCYLDLTKDGTSVVPTATEKERLKQMAERHRAYPWVRVFLGVGGPGALEDGFDAFSARGSNNLTVVRLCRSLRKLSREIGTEGVLFHPPDMVAAAFHAFLIKLHGCLDAFDVEVSVVISDDAIEDVAFLKYAPYFRSFKNVIIWTHTPSTAYATCPFDRATLDPWYQWLERKPLSVLARSVMTLSLGPLHYAAPSGQQARASSCLRQKIGQPPSRVAYAQVRIPEISPS
ncbi:unnamed protein product, partial [Ixodes pacificus]